MGTVRGRGFHARARLIDWIHSIGGGGQEDIGVCDASGILTVAGEGRLVATLGGAVAPGFSVTGVGMSALMGAGGTFWGEESGPNPSAASASTVGMSALMVAAVRTSCVDRSKHEPSAASASTVLGNSATPFSVLGAAMSRGSRGMSVSGEALDVGACLHFMRWHVRVWRGSWWGRACHYFMRVHVRVRSSASMTIHHIMLHVRGWRDSW